MPSKYVTLKSLIVLDLRPKHLIDVCHPTPCCQSMPFYLADARQLFHLLFSFQPHFHLFSTPVETYDPSFCIHLQT